MAKGMAGMMKQAQKLQARLAKVQEELASKVVEGSSGGGMVVARANGQQQVVGIRIDPEVVAAIQQAREKAQEMADREMQRATSGMLPPGVNLGI